MTIRQPGPTHDDSRQAALLGYAVRGLDPGSARDRQALPDPCHSRPGVARSGPTDPGMPRFPAVLDTGFNHNIAIREQQLRSWAHITPTESRHYITVQGRRIPLISASLWIFPNKAGELALSNRLPIRLSVPEGVAVHPEDNPNPARLPILGLRALVNNQLKLAIDCRRRTVTLRTAGWF